MTAMSNDEFAKAVMSLGTPQDEFAPSATYIPEGDCLECIFAPDDYYAERIDGLVTAYYSRETGRIVGSLIKGFDAFCRQTLREVPGFAIVIEDGTVTLEHVFLAHVFALSGKYDQILARKYQKLIEVAGQTDLKVTLTCV